MRAVLALVMLAGFFVLGAALTAFLVVVSVWRFRIGDFQGGGWTAFFAASVAVPMLWAVLRAIFARPAPTGVPMTRAAHPELWRHVDELAALAGTRSPDDVRLIPEANAGVWERRGTRYLQLGLPLVAGLSIGELRSVLAHELGHYGGGHTQVSAVTFRAKVALELAVNQGDFMRLLYGWAKLYALVAASESREHERFADEVAVAAAGQEAARRALLRIGPVGEAWSDYLRWYVSLAVLAGRTPPLVEGFRHYLDHPRRVHQLRELEPVLAEQEPTSIFDSHPPVRERVAAMALLPSVSAVSLDERPAWTLLDGTPPEAVAALIEVEGLPITWEELAPLTGHVLVRRYAEALRHAGRVSKVGDTLAAVLACLERGELHRLTGRPVDASLTPEQVHEAAVDTVTELLACAVADQLVTAGRAVLEINWGGLFALRLPDGAAVYPDDLVAPAVRDASRVAEVRLRLQAIGVDGL
ncbi:Zn-dependent protease with chaperone function [Lentzea atacamensis]|uniref:Zn-dependent protease with chaperone function n=1 Tax=Lentzea atacamensis TaxID=531938 RepID=A0A316IDZ3_9PSEU|nr:M48 family metallopeptidase [Lentzea atacamensis]PWK91209.1 Zn-dependent protease with chaperone function [Lentzea atacamensis]